ncbi:hypothetical protein [Leptolyngbya sp. FACHB-16]|uniref:hypothetical protein n=1 Tax=unclassified Leptolyngbya TaxID=2650499 RepID=UPI001684D7CA|nr:hypothetical protein [Leptolyngbya sp. FACHB-16]MBD2155951.1 hypothetical protein [Leptolyngbya sp. FACHB-16]
MTQSNLVDRAKQGDPQAIATLMNRSLQPKGILARVNREGDHLRIYLEAEQVPNRDALMTFVQNGLSNLHIANISVVEVIGQQSGQNEAAWTQEWQIDPEEAETGIEFISRGDPEVVVLQRNHPPVPPPRPIPPPAPPRPMAFSGPVEESLKEEPLKEEPLKEESLKEEPLKEEPLEELDDLDFNEAELFSMREGLSGLAYSPLEAEPLAATPTNNSHGLDATTLEVEPEDDELPPELLAAEVARQVQQEIPSDLLIDEGAEGSSTAAGSLGLTDEAIGVAQFPSVNDLALANELYMDDDVTPEAEPSILEEPYLEESDLNPNFLPEDEYPDLATDELPPPPPPPPQMEITPSPDMDAGDDLQITYLDEDEDEDTIVTEIEPDNSFDNRGGLVIEEPTPQGQMIGSPIAIQPIHPPQDDRDGSRKSGVGLWVWLVAFFLTGWIGALIGLAIWKDRQEPTPTPQPRAEQLRSV